ncbi:MAG: prephenate dehydrogenase/arogenate dehydrogenase family protein [Candidatus Aminicenantales bacterium]
MAPSSSSISRITVIGLGQMGSWFASQLKEIVELAIYDRDHDKMKGIKGVYPLSNLSQLKDFRPDCVLNAVNIENTIPVFKSILDYLPADCLLADITSVKGELPRYYQEWQRRFVSSHPMFGPTLADINHLADENAIIISESDEKGKAFFRSFYSRFNLNLYEYTFSEHDQIIAYSLTVPFASTMAFAAHLHSSAVPGTTFKKHLEIAQGLLQESDYLLAEILFNPHSLLQLEKITQRLEFLKHVIQEKDYEEAFNFFRRLRENIKK